MSVNLYMNLMLSYMEVKTACKINLNLCSKLLYKQTLHFIRCLHKFPLCLGSLQIPLRQNRNNWEQAVKSYQDCHLQIKLQMK